MSIESIFKIWGKRLRVHLDSQHETDLLYLQPDTFCSLHSHVNKINKFFVIMGKVKIQTEYGETILLPNESWVVHPPIRHKFIALEPSIMLEMAYVKSGEIDPNDINREKQGGRIVNGEELTIEQLRENGLLDL